MGYFSRSFIKARAALGFKTGYAFYHDNGGRRVFPFTYSYYKKIERGASLPPPAWLAPLIECLRFVGPVARAQLTSDYLRDLCGDEAAYDLLFAQLIRQFQEPAARRAMRNLRGHMTCHVTPDQYRFLAGSLEAYGCHMVLSNTSQALPAARVAEILGVDEKVCAKVLANLCRIGLAKVVKGGRYACRAKFHWMPTDPESRRLASGLRKRLDALAEKRGMSYTGAWAVMRLDQADIPNVVGALQHAVSLAISSGVVAPDGYDAPLCLVECRLRRLDDSSRV